MSSRFYLHDTPSPPSPRHSSPSHHPTANGTHNSHTHDQTSNSSDSRSSSPLPFPEPLSRAPFSQPNFTPTTYLTSIVSSPSAPRFQTLSDLHADLESLSAQIQAELVEVVNAHYADFLDVAGNGLRGGGEKVEEVRVGVWGVRGQIGEVREGVEGRIEEVQRLMGELRGVRREVGMGVGLLEWEDRMGGLEDRLGLGNSVNSDRVNGLGGGRGHNDGNDDNEDEASEEDEDHNSESESLNSSSDNDEDSGDTGISLRLRRQVEEFRIIRALSGNLGLWHPFIVKQQDRVSRLRSKLLSELEIAMRASETEEARRDIIKMRISLDEEVRDRQSERAAAAAAAIKT